MVSQSLQLLLALHDISQSPEQGPNDLPARPRPPGVCLTFYWILGIAAGGGRLKYEQKFETVAHKYVYQ